MPSLLPQGIAGLAPAIVLVTFSFGGIEAVAMTAPESADPRRVLPRATRWTIFRLALFYLLSMIVILAISPALGKTPDGRLEASPFVQLFAPSASRCGGSDELCRAHGGALGAQHHPLRCRADDLLPRRDGQAPAFTTRLSRQGIPVYAVLVSAVGLMLAAAVTIVSPDDAFLEMLGIAAFGGLTTWAIILLTHKAFRRRDTAQDLSRLPIRLPGVPWTSGLAVLALAAMVIGMLFIPMFQSAWIVGAAFVAIVVMAYLVLLRRNPSTIHR